MSSTCLQYTITLSWSLESTRVRLMFWCRVFFYSILLKNRNFFPFLQNVHASYGAHPASYATGAVFLFPGIKRSGFEVDHKSPSNTKLKSEWSYTSAASYVFMVSTGTTFTFFYLWFKFQVRDFYYKPRDGTSSWVYSFLTILIKWLYALFALYPSNVTGLVTERSFRS
jgi:hypothetical protein